MNDPGAEEHKDFRGRKRGGDNGAPGKAGSAKKHEKPTTKKVDLYVVVADDDVDDHKLITKAVKDCGGNHLVTSVYNGLQLMNLLLRKGFYKVDFDRLPDIIILDLKMPVMDGYDALKAIRAHEELKNIPVFVLSDAEGEEEKRKVSDHGGDKFYSKPFSYEELKQLMVDICSEAVKLAEVRRIKQS
jgi:CheY-like chemotaxis protein